MSNNSIVNTISAAGSDEIRTRSLVQSPEKESELQPKEWWSAIIFLSFFIGLLSITKVYEGTVADSFVIPLYIIFIIILVRSPELIPFVMFVGIIIRPDLSLLPVCPFRMAWHEILISVALVLITYRNIIHKQKVAFLSIYILFLIAMIPSFVIGWSRALLPGIVLRDGIGCIIVGSFIAGMLIDRPSRVELLVRYAAGAWIVSLYARIFLVFSGLNPEAVQIFYGDQSAVFTSFTICYLVYRRSLGSSKFHAFTFITITLFLIFTMITGGRIATITVVTSTILAFSVIRHRLEARDYLSFRPFVVITFVFVVGVAIYSLDVLPKFAQERFDELFKETIFQASNGFSSLTSGDISAVEGGTINWRMMLNYDAVLNFLQEPWTGIGWGTPLTLSFNFGSVEGTIESYIRPGTIHNTPLVLLCGSGIIGFCAYILIVARVIGHTWKKSRYLQPKSYNNIYKITLFASLLVSFAQPLYVSELAAWVWCLVGFWIIAQKNHPENLNRV